MHLEIVAEKPEKPGRRVPILFVHGMWFGAWCWEKYFLRYFAMHGYNAYAFNLRGHGGSGTLRSFRRVSLYDYYDDLVEVCSGFAQQPVLVGHSMGGFIVQNYLEHHRPAAGAVLLASVPPTGALALTLRIIRRYPLVALKVNLMMSMRHLVATPELFREMHFSEGIPDELLSAFFERIGDDSYRAFLEMLVPRMKRESGCKVPMLVLGAGDDAIISEKDVLRTGCYYGVDAELFPGMPHCMMLDSGWQVVADKILAWLDSNGF